MDITAAFFLFMVLPAILIIVGDLLWQAIKQFIVEAVESRERVRELHQQNYELRDELERLKQHR